MACGGVASSVHAQLQADLRWARGRWRSVDPELTSDSLDSLVPCSCEAECIPSHFV